MTAGAPRGRRRVGGPAGPPARDPAPHVRTARSVAIEALLRIDAGGYANLVVPALLDRCRLADADRRFVTELVYGVTRLRRALDASIDPFLVRDVDARTRAGLRLGTYQLVVLATPPHAAVSSTVEAVGGRSKGLVNAVLRRIATSPPVPTDDASRLSYPDWIVDRLVADLGRDRATAALEAMNGRAVTHVRDDGYVQDPASLAVVAQVGATAGEVVVDVCAAPGGKATALAGSGCSVVAVELHPGRARLLERNRRATGAQRLAVVRADGRSLPLAAGSVDRVLVDAPCSGLGSLRRRPDARWRVDDAAPERLATLQRDLLAQARRILRPGGTLVYSVCTLTATETLGIDRWLSDTMPDLEAQPTMRRLDGSAVVWEPWGRGALVLPTVEGSDGMFVLVLRDVGHRAT